MQSIRPVFLFSDFGWSGPYVGQMAAAVIAVEPRVPVVHLMHDAPAFRPELAAYLLAACCAQLPERAVVVAVVDPGVGGDRAALQVETGRLTLIGPDNGLLSRVADIRTVHRIDWRPAALSSSFHGRDLFAPVGARTALGRMPEMTAIAADSIVGADWPENIGRIVYIDGYGNAMTGLSASAISKNKRLRVKGQPLSFAATFGEVARGELFWYFNSQGLVEIAANQASAAACLALALGDNFLVD